MKRLPTERFKLIIQNARTLSLIPLFLGALVAGCSVRETILPPTLTPAREPQSPTPTAVLSSTPIPTQEQPQAQLPTPVVNYGYTFQGPDGNRFVEGRGDVPNLKPLDIPLSGRPTWLVAAIDGEASIWVAASQEGSLQAFRVARSTYQQIPIQPASLPPGAPPLLEVSDSLPVVRVPLDPQASPLTHPAVFNHNPSRLAYITTGGELVIWENAEIARLAVDALPDARLLVDENDRILLLTGPTERYDHGVLGDAVEATVITLIETQPNIRVATTIPVDAPAVIEGIAPIWVDITGDGLREIIVTVSDRVSGARLEVFDEAGQVVASGPAIGLGYRWRNQMVLLPGPDDASEIVDVLTPHINGVVEFYQMESDRLEIVAQAPGYTSHVIGTRNLDIGLAGDFDADGRVEVVLPNQTLTSLGAIRHEAQGAVVAWDLPIEGQVSTNLAGLALADGSLALGVGLEDGRLRVWSP
jgi:hypothetical protein